MIALSRIQDYFGLHRDEAATSREVAERLIRDAGQIFVAYAHSDLAVAQRFRTLVLGLRRSKLPGSVFLDQASLEPGAHVSPQQVDERIRASDLMLVLCGERTARSVEVQREIRLALETEGAVLMPVIIRPHVALPPDLDYRRQGIFLSTLFPSIPYFRRATAAALVLSVLGLAILGYVAHDAGREQSRAEIDAELLRDQDGRVPTNLNRRLTISSLAEKATRVGHRADEVRRLLAQIPESAARSPLLDLGPGQEFLAVARDGGTLAIGAPDQITLVDLAAAEPAATHVIDLTRIATKPPPGQEADKDWYRRETPGATISRAPARLVRLEADKTADGFEIEVEYAGFAIAPPPGTDEARDGESEAFRLDTDGAITPLGLSRELHWAIGHDPNYEENGPSWYEAVADGTDAFWRRRDQLPAQLVDRLGIPFDPELERIDLERIAIDPASDAWLVAIRHFFDADSRIWDTGDRFSDIYVSLLPAEGTGQPLSEVTHHYVGARHLSARDTPPNTYTDEIPVFTPAAVNTRAGLAALHDRVIATAPTNGPREISRLPLDSLGGRDSAMGAAFSADARTLALALGDGSFALVGPCDGAVKSRFFPPVRTVMARVQPDARAAFVLLDDGRVERWNLDGFGPDGWAIGETAVAPDDGAGCVTSSAARAPGESARDGSPDAPRRGSP